MRHIANSGNSTLLKEDTYYDLTLKSYELDEDGQFGPQVKFVFEIDDVGGGDEWIFASCKLGKHQGRVSKLRGIANAAFGKPEKTEIEYFDDEDFTFKYADEAKPRRLEVGAKLRAKGEIGENSKGEDAFRFNRFATSETIDPSEIPF